MVLHRLFTMKEIPIVPGRGLISNTAVGLRQSYIENEGYTIEQIKQHGFDKNEIQNNIESFIGSVEVPVGLCGPLLFRHNSGSELVYAAAATTEGALIASLNRGAKALSKSGGFSAHVLHQKMVRAPLFLFSNMADAVVFKAWIAAHFGAIKQVTAAHSNHAVLQEIITYLIGRNAHLKFVYTTGDASGQNMTTNCTWHAILWIAEHFAQETGIRIEHFILEGNAASDKKVSQAAILNGRGTHVAAECFLNEAVINKILRTSSEAIFRYYGNSLAMSKIDGMAGYNINVANAIAAIFAATGQDLGSVHESGNGVLYLEKTDNGLYLALHLPTLVVGTIGGGTHLPKQKEALQLMQCYGNGKAGRFAKLIAGFALSLEISTYSAIVSGEFAKAHEKLGRNKPVRRLLMSEITPKFIAQCIRPEYSEKHDFEAIISRQTIVDNGIINNITHRVSKKIIGFVPVEVEAGGTAYQVLLKSKALDTEVIKGLCVMAASIDPALSDLIETHAPALEYRHTHLKEMLLYEDLHKQALQGRPAYFGKYINPKREIYIVAIEALNLQQLKHINTENQPGKWSGNDIREVIQRITTIHRHYQRTGNRQALQSIKTFRVSEAQPLYNKLLDLVVKESESPYLKKKYAELYAFVAHSENEHSRLNMPQTIIHNDFNTRNIAVRRSGTACIYDWELAVVNFPQRDIIEFLSFCLPLNFEAQQFLQFIEFHASLYPAIPLRDMLEASIYAAKEYLVTRVSFYEVAGILMKYEFSGRVAINTFRMIELLENQMAVLKV